MRVAVLTGGGDCPGLNAVIRAVTKSLLSQCKAEVIGIDDGFLGFIERRTRPLDWRSVSGLVGLGGTVLGTSNRSHPFNHQGRDHSQAVLDYAKELALDALVVIGGDGSLAIGHRLSERGLPVVGVPKTIDNDIIGCDRSFGFDTAVATATEAIDRLQTTAQSHGRVMIVETMGRDAGWIALEAGIAGGADILLLPEIPFSLDAVAARCRERAQRQRYTVICVGEGASAIGQSRTVAQIADDPSAPERLGGVAHVLRRQLEPLLGSEVRATVLGHVQRGGTPTAFDRVLATQYGNAAAQLVRERQFNRVVTLSEGALGSVELAQVAAGRRTVPADHPLLVCARQTGISLGEA